MKSICLFGWHHSSPVQLPAMIIIPSLSLSLTSLMISTAFCFYHWNTFFDDFLHEIINSIVSRASLPRLLFTFRSPFRLVYLLVLWFPIDSDSQTETRQPTWSEMHWARSKSWCFQNTHELDKSWKPTIPSDDLPAIELVLKSTVQLRFRKTLSEKYTKALDEFIF